MAKKVDIDLLNMRRREVDEKLDNHPKRFYYFSDRNGNTHTFDLKQAVALVRRRLKDVGGSESELAEVTEIRNEFIQPLISERQSLTRTINQTLKTLVGGEKSGESMALDHFRGILIDLFGGYKTMTEVREILDHDYYTKVSLVSLRQWFQLNKEAIDVERTNFELENGRQNNRVATEEGRLHVFNKLLAFWEKKLNSGTSDKTASEMILKVLNYAKNETKGEIITVQGRVQIDIRATLQADQNVRDIFSRIHINSLILGLAAAQKGLSPASLIAPLVNSWYAKLNGFNGEIKDIEIEHPSSIIKTFDWGSISAKPKEKPVLLEKKPSLATGSMDDKLNKAAELARKFLDKKKNGK